MELLTHQRHACHISAHSSDMFVGYILEENDVSGEKRGGNESERETRRPFETMSAISLQ